MRLRHVINEITAEHTCIMINPINNSEIISNILTKG